MPNPQDIYQKTVLFARVTGELMKRAQAADEARQKQAEAIAKQIPITVEALRAGERIMESEKEAVAQGLSDPITALDLMAKLAYHKNSDELRPTGGPAPGTQVKKASLHMCGAPVADWDATEGGQAFRRILMGE